MNSENWPSSGPLFVFAMNLEEKMIAEELVENMNSWKHSGFSVYYAQPIEACDDNGRKTLSEYISRALFSFEKAVPHVPDGEDSCGLYF